MNTRDIGDNRDTASSLSEPETRKFFQCLMTRYPDAKFSSVSSLICTLSGWVIMPNFSVNVLMFIVDS